VQPPEHPRAGTDASIPELAVSFEYIGATPLPPASFVGSSTTATFETSASRGPYGTTTEDDAPPAALSAHSHTTTVTPFDLPPLPTPTDESDPIDAEYVRAVLETVPDSEKP
jgi:hypothetical protein